MNKLAGILLLLFVVLAALPLFSYSDNPRSVATYDGAAVESPPPILEPASSGVIESAFRNRQSDFLVDGAGSVANILPDDLEPPRHQRFILRLSSGHTVLIAHNTDIAPRVPNLKVGDIVQFLGEYAWNEKGGVIHWTHHDPGGRHVSGYLIHAGTRYSKLFTRGTDERLIGTESL